MQTIESVRNVEGRTGGVVVYHRQDGKRLRKHRMKLSRRRLYES